jgi:mono/diheme cytochrome c family protein
MRILSFFVVIVLLFGCESKPKKRASAAQLKPDSAEQLATSIERGGMLYTDFCMQCHMANGKGIEGTFPPLAGSDWLTRKRSESIHAVKYGQSGEIVVNGKTYNSVMVAMGLSDEEVADALNYVMNSWGNTQQKMVTAAEVSKVTE